jgi:two-component system, OmpR family, phosphate regulon sensor histidine kinase PhoR
MWSSRLLLRLALVYVAIQALILITFLFVLDRWNAEGAKIISADASDAVEWFSLHRAGAWYLGATLGFSGVLATLLAAGWIMRPLARLARGAQALARADQAASRNHDELSMLGSAFDQMKREIAGRVRQLEENSERLATVLGNMAEGVIALDARENITLANEASRRLLDFVTGDAVGRPLVEVTRIRAVHEAAASAMTSDRVVEAEIELTSPTRREISLRAKRFPGDPSPGVVIVLYDITELRRLENLRREFVANVSHELKTPLASIKAYAETLRMGAINDAQHNLGFVARIEEQAERLNQLILDMIHIARMEAGSQAFEMVDVDMAEIVDISAEYYRALAEKKGLTLVVEQAGQPVVVRVDEEGLRTIFDNLIDNAIKYTPAGGAIQIRWSSSEGEAIFEVEDTGIGIAPSDQPRVFERFFRVDKARNREVGGTGLGLSIVKHLAHAFGGQVGLESHPGKGSRFFVRFPLAAVAKRPAIT